MENEVVSIIENYRDRMPSEFLDECISLAEHSEWGVALENLCVQLYEYDIVPSKIELDKIKSIADKMGMGQDVWGFLEGDQAST
jgi:hypothetical protein